MLQGVLSGLCSRGIFSLTLSVSMRSLRHVSRAVAAATASKPVEAPTVGQGLAPAVEPLRLGYRRATSRRTMKCSFSGEAFFGLSQFTIEQKSLPFQGRWTQLRCDGGVPQWEQAPALHSFFKQDSARVGNVPFHSTEASSACVTCQALSPLRPCQDPSGLRLLKLL